MINDYEFLSLDSEPVIQTIQKYEVQLIKDNKIVYKYFLSKKQAENSQLFKDLIEHNEHILPIYGNYSICIIDNIMTYLEKYNKQTSEVFIDRIVKDNIEHLFEMISCSNYLNIESLTKILTNKIADLIKNGQITKHIQTLLKN